MEEAPGDRAQLDMLSRGGQESRSSGRNAPRRDQGPSGQGKLLQLAVAREGDALDTGKDHRPIAIRAQRQGTLLDPPELGQGLVVEEVEAKTGLQHPGHDVGPEALAQGLDHLDASGCEVRPGVVIGQVDRHVIGRLPLTEDEAEPLEIARQVRHHDPPRVLLVEYPGGVEPPPRIRDPFRGVRPAMADELVDPLQEMQVGLRLHVEGSGPEGRGVQPRPGLRRGHRTAVEMARGGRPARGPQRLPLMPLALGEVREGVARERRRGDAVALEPEARPVPPRPLPHGRQEALVQQLGERHPPVVPDACGFWAHLGHEGRQVRPEVVAPPLLELLEKVRGPVGAVDFEAVAEDRVGRTGSEALHQPVADDLQIMLEAAAIIVIEHQAVRADRRPLDHHAGPARNEGQNLVRPGETRRKVNHAVPDVGDLADAPRGQRFTLGAGQEGADPLLTRADVGSRDAPDAFPDLHSLDAQPSRRLPDRNLGPPVGPPAAERQVHPQPQLPSLDGSEPEGLDELVREEGKVLDARGRVVESDRVDGLDLETADPALLHEAHLALQLRLRHRRPEPPPAHHDAAVVGRVLERPAQLADRCRLREGGRGDKRRKQGGQGETHRPQWAFGGAARPPTARAIAASASGAITAYPAAFGWRPSSFSSGLSRPWASARAEK